MPERQPKPYSRTGFEQCPQFDAPTQVEGGCPSCTRCSWSKCGGVRR